MLPLFLADQQQQRLLLRKVIEVHRGFLNSAQLPFVADRKSGIVRPLMNG
jgi:hypothetical protein